MKITRIEGYNGKYGSNPHGSREISDDLFEFDQIGQWIDDPQPTITIELVQSVAGIKAFYKKSENHDREVQASSSSSLIIQILILSTPWIRKWV